MLAEVGACSGNDQIADCSRTEAATGVVFVDLVHQFRQICRRRTVQRFVFEQAELELNSLRNSQLMKSFLHDAVNVIASAASTQHPGSFVHDSLEPVEEVLRSSS